MFVAALAISSTIVDVSPFSTNGALMLANRPDTIEEQVYYKQILTYSVIVVARGSAAGVGRSRASRLVIATSSCAGPTEGAAARQVSWRLLAELGVHPDLPALAVDVEDGGRLGPAPLVRRAAGTARPGRPRAGGAGAPRRPAPRTGTPSGRAGGRGRAARARCAGRERRQRRRASGGRSRARAAAPARWRRTGRRRCARPPRSASGATAASAAHERPAALRAAGVVPAVGADAEHRLVVRRQAGRAPPPSAARSRSSSTSGAASSAVSSQGRAGAA